MLLHGTRHPAHKVSAPARTLRCTTSLCEILRQIRRPTPPELVRRLLKSLQENFLHALLAENLQQLLSVEVLRSCALLQQKSSTPLLRIATLSLRLACACLARLWCQICTSENLEQKLSLLEPCSHALLADKFNCTPCRNSLVQDRETIETNSLFSQTSIQP
jgi:hypothetical protein